MTSAVATDTLLQNLRLIAGEFSVTLAEESSAIRAAKFAHAIGLQDKKIELHQRLFNMLEKIKDAPKTEIQKEELRILVGMMSAKAQENKRSIEIGFGAIERLTGKIFSIMRKTVQRESASYTAAGTYHRARGHSANLQTDRTA